MKTIFIYRSVTKAFCFFALFGLFGCGDDGMMSGPDGGPDSPDSGADGDGTIPDGGSSEVPEVYGFSSGLTDGESSVSYGGQIARQVLIADLTDYLADLSGLIDDGTFEPTSDGEVVAALDFWFRFDGDSNGGESFRLETTPATAQSTYDDVSTGKNLVGKLAGNDDVTDHADWDGGDFRGWSDGSIAEHGGAITSPEALLTAFFETIEENALGRADGAVRTGPDGAQLPVYVTDEGLDVRQLVQKLLLGAINYSQGTDDYLDSGTDGKGLAAGNVEADDDGKPYTTLEHAWDEGFGYFGAARDYGDYTDDEIAGKGGREGWSNGYHDSDDDGTIDLKSEYNFGHSVNAAKRDRGSNAAASTDFSGDAFSAFLEGRALINDAVGRALTTAETAALEEIRNTVVLAWERAIAATVVHYINEVVAETLDIGTSDYNFLDHAKTWSELKGFALGLQFNPRSELSNTAFAALHELIGDAPVLEAAGSTPADDYVDDLLEARDLIQESYGFADANMGDQTGEGGW